MRTIHRATFHSYLIIAGIATERERIAFQASGLRMET
jgi:hypothetical protein